MSGAGGCRITAARNVRTRQRAGRIKLKGLPGIVTRSRDGTFLISRSWCQRKGSFIEPQCEGQAEFETHPSHPGVDRRAVCDLPPDAAGRLGTRRPRPRGCYVRRPRISGRCWSTLAEHAALGGRRAASEADLSHQLAALAGCGRGAAAASLRKPPVGMPGGHSFTEQDWIEHTQSQPSGDRLHEARVWTAASE